MTIAPEVLAGGKPAAVRELVLLPLRANGTVDLSNVAGAPRFRSAATVASLTGLTPGTLVLAEDGTAGVAGNDGAPAELATKAYVDTATEDIPNITEELAAVVAENADVVIPMALTILQSTGIWVPSRVSAALWVLTRTAAAAVTAAYLMAQIRQRKTAGKGFKITGCVVKYKVATADINDLTIDGNVTVMPATGSAVAAATSLGTVTYDSNHDTSAERKAQGEHTMTVTFGTPIYLNGNAEVEIAIICDGTASGALTVNKVSLLGAETLVDAS